MTTVEYGTNRYLCPVRCGWYHDVPPPSVADMDWSAARGTTDISDAIGRVTQDTAVRRAAATEAALVTHLDTHTTRDFVTALERLHGQVAQLDDALADRPATEES